MSGNLAVFVDRYRCKGVGISFSLAGSARLGTGEAAAHPVLLDVDLPAVLIFHPFSGVCSFAHKNTPPGMT